MPSTLAEDEAHVWLIEPETVRDSDILADFRALLSADELEQCDRFHFAEDGHRYLVSHALRRKVLPGYADLDPADWCFTRTTHGRPEIANTEAEGTRFNLTHTRGLAACIVTRNVDCGIDAEILDSRHNLKGIEQRMYAAEELHQMEALDGAELIEAFFSRWVLREAFVKAKGIGISYPTRKLNFDIRDTHNIGIRFDPGLVESDGWQFKLMRPTKRHIAAVALLKNRPSSFRVVQHSFKPDREY